MKQKIDLHDYTGAITKALPSGILLTTKADGKVNTMTIGWGMIGTDWSRPVFITFVRKSRFTHELLEKNGEFTINVPIDEFNKEIINICGTKSGRDIDKIKEMNLTLEEPEEISVPAIREFPLTLECRVVYKQDQDPAAIPQTFIDRFYPEKSDGKRDFHTAYYAEIVAAYIVK